METAVLKRGETAQDFLHGYKSKEDPPKLLNCSHPVRTHRQAVAEKLSHLKNKNACISKPKFLVRYLFRPIATDFSLSRYT